jgi:hypothetical protein
MTGVMLGQGMIPVLLFIVCGHIRPIGGSGCRGWGPRGSPSCQRGPRVLRARQKYAERVKRFDDIMGLGRGGTCHPRRLSRLRPLRKAQVGWRLTLGFEQLTCYQRL